MRGRCGPDEDFVVKDKYTVPAIQLDAKYGHGFNNMVLERFSDKRKSVAVYFAGHDHVIENIIGIAKFWRRDDGIMMMAEIEFLAVPKRRYLEEFWNRGIQLYVNPHMRRSYDPNSMNSHIDIEAVELEETCATPPYGYTPCLFSWP